MKLVMETDDGKEIVYLSGDDYNIGTVSTYPDDMFIMINNLSIEKKNTLIKFLNLKKNYLHHIP